MLESIGTGKTFTNSYGANGCPDKGAGGMFTYAESKGMDWGRIDTIPEIAGLAVTMSGHIGYYIGNGNVVEWRGFAYGCVITKLKGRGWQYWYKLPFIQYGKAADQEPPEVPESSTDPKYDYGTRLLRYRKGISMLRGDDVFAVQARLMELGFDPGKADGIYGPLTEKAVKTFQASASIGTDGIVGPITRSALSKQ